MKIEPYDNLSLSETQFKVLGYLAQDYDSWGEGRVHIFKITAKNLGIEQRLVRLACRALARKGLAEHTRAVDGDGMCAGSGYCATEKGAEVIERNDEFEAAKQVSL